jgi:hypothetical protein
MVSLMGKASPLKRLLQECVVLGVLLPGLALAAQPRGVWTGLVQQANTDVSSEVTFGVNSADVHFGPNLSCSVPATFLKEVGVATVYRFGVTKNGGKFCEGLMGRDLTFTPEPDGRLAIDFPSAKTTWHGNLKPSPAVTTHP